MAKERGLTDLLKGSTIGSTFLDSSKIGKLIGSLETSIRHFGNQPLKIADSPKERLVLRAQSHVTFALDKISGAGSGSAGPSRQHIKACLNMLNPSLHSAHQASVNL
jgi:hypothetical protein